MGTNSQNNSTTDRKWTPWKIVYTFTFINYTILTNKTVCQTNACSDRCCGLRCLNGSHKMLMASANRISYTMDRDRCAQVSQAATGNDEIQCVWRNATSHINILRCCKLISCLFWIFPRSVHLRLALSRLSPSLSVVAVICFLDWARMKCAV